MGNRRSRAISALLSSPPPSVGSVAEVLEPVSAPPSASSVSPNAGPVSSGMGPWSDDPVAQKVADHAVWRDGRLIIESPRDALGADTFAMAAFSSYIGKSDGQWHLTADFPGLGELVKIKAPQTASASSGNSESEDLVATIRDAGDVNTLPKATLRQALKAKLVSYDFASNTWSRLS